jgi:nucleoside-diphosphate-sugar epimerase
MPPLAGGFGASRIVPPASRAHPSVTFLVLETEPDAIVHQATALADVRFSKHLDRTFAQTNRLRREGTDALLAAAREAGVRRFVAQSYANMRYAREGDRPKPRTIRSIPPRSSRCARPALR